MADKQVFKIIAGTMAVYDKVGGTKIGRIPNGISFEAEADSRTEHLGSVWWKHSAGWSIEKTMDGATIFLEPIGGIAASGDTSTTTSSDTSTDTTTTTSSSDTSTDTTTTTSSSDTSTDTSTTTSSSDTSTDTTTTTSSDTSTDTTTTSSDISTDTATSSGTVSASVSTSVVVEDTKPEDAPAQNPLVAKLAGDLANVKTKANLRSKGSVKVRDAAAGTAKENSLNFGDIVQADMETLVEKNGYYWASHTQGWSAIQSIDGGEVFFEDAGDIYVPGPDGPKLAEMPGYQSLITRHFVDLDKTNYFQYFGNNNFAYMKGRDFNYHRFAQGLHSGLDYGTSAFRNVQVFAGVHGTYVQTIPDHKGRVWNKQIRVQTKEGYLIIYQHINTNAFTKGQEITPDTVIGTVNEGFPGNGAHLHLEIRYNNQAWIVNPLDLMTKDLSEAIITKFDPTRPGTGWSGSELYYFYKTSGWDKWATPYEQPVIVRQGPTIDPRSMGA